MESNWAAEHIQVIRTLMERSALYRRALAPIMILNGALGTAGGIVGWNLRISSTYQFVGFWTAVAAVALAGSFLLMRRQALKAAEPFWTPPTRRVMTAFTPPICFGAVVAASVIGCGSPEHAGLLLPPVWMGLYGCGLHAAGFFMPRGIKILGWMFVVLGSTLLILEFGCRHDLLGLGQDSRYGNIMMGAVFGGLHLAAGVYLYFTEQRRNET